MASADFLLRGENPVTHFTRFYHAAQPTQPLQSWPAQRPAAVFVQVFRASSKNPVDKFSPARRSIVTKYFLRPLHWVMTDDLCEVSQSGSCALRLTSAVSDLRAASAWFLQYSETKDTTIYKVFLVKPWQHKITGITIITSSLCVHYALLAGWRNKIDLTWRLLIRVNIPKKARLCRVLKPFLLISLCVISLWVKWVSL